MIDDPTFQTCFFKNGTRMFFWFLVFQNLRNTTRSGMFSQDTHNCMVCPSCLGRHLTTIWMLPQLFKVTFQPTHRKLQQVAFLFFLSWSLRSSVSGLGQRVSRGPKRSSDTPESSADVLNSNLRSRKPHIYSLAQQVIRSQGREFFFGKNDGHGFLVRKNEGKNLTGLTHKSGTSRLRAVLIYRDDTADFVRVLLGTTNHQTTHPKSHFST